MALTSARMRISFSSSVVGRCARAACVLPTIDGRAITVPWVVLRAMLAPLQPSYNFSDKSVALTCRDVKGRGGEVPLERSLRSYWALSRYRRRALSHLRHFGDTGPVHIKIKQQVVGGHSLGHSWARRSRLTAACWLGRTASTKRHTSSSHYAVNLQGAHLVDSLLLLLLEVESSESELESSSLPSSRLSEGTGGGPSDIYSSKSTSTN